MRKHVGVDTLVFSRDRVNFLFLEKQQTDNNKDY